MTAGTDGSEQIHAALLHYLKRLGYTQTEQALRDEARSFGVDALAFEMQVQDEASLSASVLFGMKKTERGFSKASTFEGHEREYMKLRQWIHGSLDLFREELLPCLFPIFAHLAIDLMIRASREDCTTTLGSVLDVRFLALGNEDHCLAHGDDLASLANITEPAHLKECSVSSTFLSSRYHINLSASSFQMFMSFLEDNGLLAVLRIVNQFLNIRGATLCNVLVYLSRTIASGSQIEGPAGLDAHGASSSVNRERVLWATSFLPPERLESLLKQKFGDQAVHAVTSTLKKYNASLPNESLPAPPHTAFSVETQWERLKTLAKDLSQNELELPSICNYVLHNTYGDVLSSDYSTQLSLFATGNRNSYIDLWSTTGSTIKAIKPSTELAAMPFSQGCSSKHTFLDTGIEDLFTDTGAFTTRLVGHSGPVYKVRFVASESPILLSASQDASAILWSMPLMSSVAKFKGHAQAIWDLSTTHSNPLYFATSSADKTARLWSTEHVSSIRVFAGHFSDVDAVRFHPNDSYLATGSSDKSCRVWDLLTGNTVRLFSGHARGVSSLCFSISGRFLVSADYINDLHFWDLAEGKRLRTISTLRSNAIRNITSLEFTPNGRIICCATKDGSVHLLDFLKAVNCAVPDADCFLSTIKTKNTPIIDFIPVGNQTFVATSVQQYE